MFPTWDPKPQPWWKRKPAVKRAKPTTYKNPVTAYIVHDDFQGSALTFGTRSDLHTFVKRNLDGYHNKLVAYGYDNSGMFSLMYVNEGVRTNRYKLVELEEAA